MKKRFKARFLFLLICPLLFVPQYSESRIRFESTRSIQIDLEKLDLNAKTFLGYVTKVIHHNPVGLQAYGQVPFNICEMTLKGRKLFDYQTLKGRKVRFMSNPSCGQLVLRRLLETSYKYNKEILGSYGSRKCIRAIEGIFSPMLEYYTIFYEEKTRSNCKRCDEKEREKLTKIADIQQKISAGCGAEEEKVNSFLNDLDAAIEKAFQTK